MKIILVNKFHYIKGGSETYYFGLADGLVKMGHDVHFFSMRDERNFPCDDADFFVSPKDYNSPTAFADKAKAAATLIYSQESKRRFQALCESVRPDVIHLNLVHRQITLAILDAPYIREHRVPVVFTSHDYILICPNYVMLDGNGTVCDACLGGHFLNCFKNRCVKESSAKSLLACMEAEFLKVTDAYSKIDHIIAPSLFMKSKLIESGISSTKVSFMQNFVSDHVHDCAEDSSDYTDRYNPYILYFGRLSCEKGVDVLIKASSVLPEGWRLVIAGDGAERKSLEVLSSSSRNRVEFLGYKAGAELVQLVAGAALSVAPSRWRENMPYSIMESFAYGTPVIGTTIGGIPELVLEGETGFLAEPDDVDSLRQAITAGVRAFDDRGQYEAIQAKCKSYVIGRCSQDSYLQRLVSLYRILIESKCDE